MGACRRKGVCENVQCMFLSYTSSLFGVCMPILYTVQYGTCDMQPYACSTCHFDQCLNYSRVLSKISNTTCVLLPISCICSMAHMIRSPSTCYFAQYMVTLGRVLSKISDTAGVLCCSPLAQFPGNWASRLSPHGTEPHCTTPNTRLGGRVF